MKKLILIATILTSMSSFAVQTALVTLALDTWTQETSSGGYDFWGKMKLTESEKDEILAKSLDPMFVYSASTSSKMETLAEVYDLSVVEVENELVEAITSL